MEDDNLKKGIFFGILCMFLFSLTPIIANSRPKALDPYLFATTTSIIEAFLFFPIMLAERRKMRSKFDKNLISEEEINSLLYGYKNKKFLLIYVGITFGVVQIMLFWGLRLAGAINGSITLKTAVFFSLVFGYLINREKISNNQVIFSILLFLGLLFAVTQGTFNLLVLNIGVLILFISVIMWTQAHALTNRFFFETKESTTIQMCFMRNVISGLFLAFTYFIFFPLENVNLLLDSINLFFIILMGISYGTALFCWYKLLSYLGTSKSSVMASGDVIITIIFATILLGEFLTIYHIIGAIIVIISVIMIVKTRRGKE